MYKIVVDSCGELPEELKKDGHFETVSLELEVDGYRIKDDETFNQLDFLRRVKKSITGPKSSCPSPEQYMQAYEGEAEHVYVVTLSGKLRFLQQCRAWQEPLRGGTSGREQADLCI